MTQDVRCNVCGRPFGLVDKYGGLFIDEVLGYGTKHDGERLCMNICCRCLESMIERCAILPLKSTEEGGEAYV